MEDNLKIDYLHVFNTFFGRIQRLYQIKTAVLQSCKEMEPPLFQEGVGWAEWPKGCEETAVL